MLVLRNSCTDMFLLMQVSDGSDTRGSYRCCTVLCTVVYSVGLSSVLLPDGRLQTVTYTVLGGAGYRATVNYSHP